MGGREQGIFAQREQSVMAEAREARDCVGRSTSLGILCCRLGQRAAVRSKNSCAARTQHMCSQATAGGGGGQPGQLQVQICEPAAGVLWVWRCHRLSRGGCAVALEADEVWSST